MRLIWVFDNNRIGNRYYQSSVKLKKNIYIYIFKLFLSLGNHNIHGLKIMLVSFLLKEKKKVFLKCGFNTLVFWKEF